jgi:hypothetical protein
MQMVNGPPGDDLMVTCTMGPFSMGNWMYVLLSNTQSLAMFPTLTCTFQPDIHTDYNYQNYHNY